MYPTTAKARRRRSVRVHIYWTELGCMMRQHKRRVCAGVLGFGSGGREASRAVLRAECIRRSKLPPMAALLDSKDLVQNLDTGFSNGTK